MKRFLLLLTASVFAFSLSARQLFIIRHGQAGYREEFHIKALSELGAKQADLLADHLLKKYHFNGTILVSPLFHTLQTACVIGKHMNKPIILEPGIQELNPGKKDRKALTGAQIQTEFKKQYPTVVIQPGPAFTDDWRVFNEDAKARMLRTRKALARILKEQKGDLLMVGHGASVGDLAAILNESLPPEKQANGKTWNCSLRVYTLDENDKPVAGLYTTEFMPDEIVTSNFRCPKIERPDDPAYMTKAQERAAKKPKKAKKKAKQE